MEYKCSTEGGVLKVSKGVLVVIKGRLVNDLYLLQGSTVNATSVSSSSNLDTTHLCHISEARMHMLSKHGLPSNRKFVMPNFCKCRVYGKQTKGSIDSDLQSLVPIYFVKRWYLYMSLTLRVYWKRRL